MTPEALDNGVPAWLALSEFHVPEGDDWLSTWERDRISRMRYTKRRDESRMARWTIKQAIAVAVNGADPNGADLRRVRIVNLPSGAPVAEVDGADTMSISMTDRAGWAAGFVRLGDAPVGCDLEVVEPRSDAFVADYFTAAERRLVEQAPLPRELLANLIWSAKESALKVLRTGLRRDTRSVEVLFESLDGDSGWQRLVVHPVEGGSIPGWWIRLGSFVLTFAAAESTPAPRSLVEPSPLAAAAPTHSWMTRPLVTPAPAGPEIREAGPASF